MKFYPGIFRPKLPLHQLPLILSSAMPPMHPRAFPACLAADPETLTGHRVELYLRSVQPDPMLRHIVDLPLVRYLKPFRSRKPFIQRAYPGIFSVSISPPIGLPTVRPYRYPVVLLRRAADMYVLHTGHEYRVWLELCSSTFSGVFLILPLWRCPITLSPIPPCFVPPTAVTSIGYTPQARVFYTYHFSLLNLLEIRYDRVAAKGLLVANRYLLKSTLHLYGHNRTIESFRKSYCHRDLWQPVTKG